MTTKQKEFLRLRSKGDYTFDEIAQKIDVSPILLVLWGAELQEVYTRYLSALRFKKFL